jgi:hypothetical protein
MAEQQQPEMKLGRIYKIVDNTTGDIYIGSTCQTLDKRLKQHINNFNSYLNDNSRSCCKSYEIICNGDFDIELIEEVEFYDRHDLNKKEGHHITATKCINKNVPGRTYHESQQAYYHANKDMLIQKSKDYYNNNKEKVHKYKSIKHICTICQGKYTNCHYSTHSKSKKHTRALIKQKAIELGLINEEPQEQEEIAVNV